jgi:hypothetical protein
VRQGVAVSDFTFGHAEFFEKEAYPAFEKFWKVGNRLLDALNAFTLNVGKPKERYHLFIRNLCMMTGLSLADVALLVGNGCGIAALKIARTALESAINAEYLRLYPAEDKDFFNWGIVEQHRKLEYTRANMPAEFTKFSREMVESTQKLYQAVRPTFFLPNSTKMRRTWCKLNLRERAEKTGFIDMYSAFYVLASELSHGSFGGIAQHVESFVGDNWQPAIQPSMTGCSVALNAAHYCTFRASLTLVQMNDVDSTPSIHELKKDYDDAWN